MVKDIKSDIFKVPSSLVTEDAALIHQCNCHVTFGSGIAKIIREKFPEAYEADKKTKHGDFRKMGSFSFAEIDNKEYPNIKWIINLYSQFETSGTKRCTNYEAFIEGISKIRDFMGKGTLLIPFRIGSDRGGADWRIIRAMIESVFGDDDNFTVLICDNNINSSSNNVSLFNKSSK